MPPKHPDAESGTRLCLFEQEEVDASNTWAIRHMVASGCRVEMIGCRHREHCAIANKGFLLGSMSWLFDQGELDETEYHLYDPVPVGYVLPES